MPAPSVYPAAYDDFVINKVGTDPKTGHADAHNLLGAAIEGMQAEMGLSPSGGWPTVKARLDYLWDETDTPVAGDVHLYDSGAGKFVAGKISNVHVDAAAALGISKLAGYPADATKFLRGDGAWAVTGSGFGTTLPASPVDSQEFVLTDSVAGGSWRWKFRYNASSGSAYKWEFIGGAPIVVNNAGSVGTSSGGYVDLFGLGITIPRSGDYIIHHAGFWVAESAVVFQSFQIDGAAAANDVWGWGSNGGGGGFGRGGGSTTHQWAGLSIGHVIRVMHRSRSDGAVPAVFYNPTLTVLPRRVA